MQDVHYSAEDVALFGILTIYIVAGMLALVGVMLGYFASHPYKPRLRWTTDDMIEGLRREFPTLPRDPDPRSVFLALRELRNRW